MSDEFVADATFNGVPYRVRGAAGEIEAVLPGGRVIFSHFDDFVKAASSAVVLAPASVADSAEPTGGRPAWLAPLVFVAVLAAAGVALYWYFVARNAPDPDMLARMLARQGECRKLMADHVRLKLIKSVSQISLGDVVAYVDAAEWEGLDTSTRLSRAVLVYCAYSGPDGYLTVTIRDVAGQNVMRLRNGQVVPWIP
jgi:hypothetical protein